MSEMKRLESRPFRAGVTEEMGGTLAGRRRRRRIRSAWSGLCVGVGGVRGLVWTGNTATVIGADTDHI